MLIAGARLGPYEYVTLDMSPGYGALLGQPIGAAAAMVFDALNYCMLLPGPEAQKHYGPALIDDHTPTPLHARCSRARLAAVLGTGLMLWLMAMGWFFTKAAKPRPAR